MGYPADSVWRNRDNFVTGREQIIALLPNKRSRELDYPLRMSGDQDEQKTDFREPLSRVMSQSHHEHQQHPPRNRDYALSITAISATAALDQLTGFEVHAGHV